MGEVVVYLHSSKRFGSLPNWHQFLEQGYELKLLTAEAAEVWLKDNPTPPQ
jgi:hypothetical protein